MINGLKIRGQLYRKDKQKNKQYGYQEQSFCSFFLCVKQSFSYGMLIYLKEEVFGCLL